MSFCREIKKDERKLLEHFEWQHYVKNDKTIWVRVSEQQLYVIDKEQVLLSYPCSTASAGVGNKKDSFCTPLGWHEISEKIGQGLPLGAILESRKWKGKVWTPDQIVLKDLILSRILWLSGCQAGYNRGGDVDSFERFIYIHGTNMEDLIGKPVSMGCVRLNNGDIIELFDQIQLGSKVIITTE